MIIDQSESTTKTGNGRIRGSVPRLLLGEETPHPRLLSYTDPVESGSPTSGPPLADLRPRDSLVLIDLAADTSYSRVERSNIFDEWKDGLISLSESVAKENTHYRQILGALILATVKKDLVDFTRQQLIAFREVTQTLRATVTTELDSRHAMRTLGDNGLLRPVPIVSDADSARLDEYVGDLLGEH